MGTNDKPNSKPVYASSPLPNLGKAMDTTRANKPFVFPEHDSAKLVLTTRQPVVESPRPTTGVGDTTPLTSDIVKRGTTLAAYFINPPLVDEYAYRRYAFRLKDAIRVHNMEKSQHFFDVYPEALITTGTNSITSYDAPVEAITTLTRDYIHAMTMYVSALATVAVLMNLKNTSISQRLAFKFKYRTILNEHATAFTGMPFNREIYDYIVRHTRVLTQKDYIGGNIVALPLWASDLRGLRGVNYLPDEAKTSGFEGIMPFNTQIKMTAASYDSMISHTSAWANCGNTYGYFWKAQDDLVNGWRIYLSNNEDQRSHYKNKDEDYALRKINEGMGIYDMVLDLPQLISDVKSNAPGDIDDFATKHMTLGAQLSGTFGQRDRDWRLHYAGMSAADYATKLAAIKWVGSDAEFVAPWFADTGTLGTPTLTSAYWSDYYARRLSDGTVLRRVSIENSDTFGSDARAANDELLGWGYYKKFMDFGDESIPLYGVTKDFATQFFSPNAEGTPEVFVVPAELDAGLMTIHQTHIPLIDTEDPFQCGFYVILSQEDAEVNAWNKFYSRAERISWDVDAPTKKDVIAYVGDAIGLHPMLHFHRNHLSNMLYRETDTFNGDGFTWDDIWTAITGGLGTGVRMGFDQPYKPFTVPLPMDVNHGTNQFVTKSAVADLSDQPWVQLDAQTAWEDIVATFDGDSLALYNNMDTIPRDLISKWNWLWFRNGPVRNQSWWGLVRVGFMGWLTALPRIIANNWVSDRRNHFLNVIAPMREISIDLSSLSYEASVVDLAATGSPIDLSLDKFQKRDKGEKSTSSSGRSDSGRSRGRRPRRSSSARNRGVESTLDSVKTDTTVRYDKTEKDERYPESDDVVKNAPDKMENVSSMGDTMDSRGTEYRKKKEKEKKDSV